MLEDLSWQSCLTYALTALVGLLLFKILKHNKKNGKLPPGPRGFPLVGSLPSIGQFSERTFAKWSKLHGPIMFVRLGSSPTVVLNSLESMQQAFIKQGHQFNGRFRSFLSEFASEKGHGIFFIDDIEDWKIQRRFGSRALAGSALQGRSLESRILDEAEQICDLIRSKNGKPFVLEPDLSETISNVINDITINRRCTDKGNESLREYVRYVVQGFRTDGFFYILLVVAPWIRLFPPFRQLFNGMISRTKAFNDMFASFIDQQEKGMDAKNPSGFMETFLGQMPQKTYTKQQLRIYIKDLLSGGTETSTTSIRWVLLYLIKNPMMQRKVHKEIDQVIGRDGQIKYDSDLPYLKAVIQEGYRIRTAVPLTIPRRTNQDIEFMGYLIPKNTQVLGNLWAVHNNPEFWPNPEEFIPERHLDANGNFVKSDRVIPFSIGPRNCLGENLARMEVFLFLVSFLQKFDILPNPNDPNPTFEGTPGPVNSAKHYLMIMRER
uniref:Cytochrome P450 2J2-like n=1 Tax=Phallusia mammillata TaxID=59560 RepID=A0A6F9DA77_9ASCI|nr:cytochrome P450 2J2-like [Phallusia mammillata]